MKYETALEKGYKAWRTDCSPHWKKKKKKYVVIYVEGSTAVCQVFLIVQKSHLYTIQNLAQIGYEPLDSENINHSWFLC